MKILIVHKIQHCDLHGKEELTILELNNKILNLYDRFQIEDKLQGPEDRPDIVKKLRRDILSISKEKRLEIQDLLEKLFSESPCSPEEDEHLEWGFLDLTPRNRLPTIGHN